MTDQPEKKSEVEDVDADFEGHRHSGPDKHGKHGKHGDISEVKSANDDDADFEGHRFSSPEKISKKS